MTSRNSRSVLKSDRLSFLKEIVTIIPIVHFIAACVYVFGYCFGFGHHIIAFFALSDIFISSLRALA